MTGASGNSGRARERVVSTFAPWWKPWRWCWAHKPVTVEYGTTRGPRCRLPRRHHNRHACFDGFDVRYFDTPNEGTP